MEASKPHVTLVLSIRQDGTPCPGCGTIFRYLRDQRLSERFDQILLHREGDDDAAAHLAALHEQERFPFLLVEREGVTSAYSSVLHALTVLGWKTP